MEAGLARLDNVLRARARRDDIAATMHTIASENLWPGLRRSAELSAYLQSISGGAADLVISSMLILLQGDDSALDDVPWRPAAADLLQKNLDRLKPFGQPPRERGAHAIFTACAGVVDAIEADLRSEIRRFSDVKQAKALQNGVLRRLNSSAGKLVLRPFIPFGDSDRDLKQLLDAITSLDTEDASELDAGFSRLQAAATKCRTTAASIGTAFSSTVLIETTEAVLRVATLTNELSKPPAALAVVAGTRPLPLRQPGVTCEVGYELRNDSEARASDIRVEVTVEGSAVIVVDDPVSIKGLASHSVVPLSTTLSVLEASAGQTLRMDVSWRNPDHSAGSTTHALNLAAQPADVDWALASVQEPFAAYPVEEARQLVGRGQLLRELSLRFRQLPLSNIYITGQRRVGKTSLVRVLARELEAADDRLVVASVEMGEVRREDGRETIGQLGRVLAKKLVAKTGSTGAVDVPAFDATLAPLNELVEDLRTLGAASEVRLRDR